MSLVWRSMGRLSVVAALLAAMAAAPLAEASPPPRRVLHQPPGLMDVDGSAVVDVALIGPHGRAEEQAARVAAHVHRAGVWTERLLEAAEDGHHRGRLPMPSPGEPLSYWLEIRSLDSSWNLRLGSAAAPITVAPVVTQSPEELPLAARISILMGLLLVVSLLAWLRAWRQRRALIDAVFWFRTLGPLLTVGGSRLHLEIGRLVEQPIVHPLRGERRYPRKTLLRRLAMVRDMDRGELRRRYEDLFGAADPELFELPALAPASEGVPSGRERRKGRRLRHQTKVIVTHEEAVDSAMSIDVSPGGMLVHSDRDYPIGATVTLRFDLEWTHVRVSGEVVHAEPGKAFGARFLDVSPEDRLHLIRLVRGLSRSARQAPAAPATIQPAAAGSAREGDDAAPRRATGWDSLLQMLEQPAATGNGEESAPSPSGGASGQAESIGDAASEAGGGATDVPSAASAPAPEPDLDELRDEAWCELADADALAIAAHSRVSAPAFRGAGEALERLLALPELRRASVIFVAMDPVLRELRASLLTRGINLLLPTDEGEVYFIDSIDIPRDDARRAVTKDQFRRRGRRLEADERPQFDVAVVGSVAVTIGGDRLGPTVDPAAIALARIAAADVAILTAVHELQIVERLPPGAGTLRVRTIATETELRAVEPGEAPSVQVPDATS